MIQREMVASGQSPPITFLFSIDTEEDDWVPARTGATVENIRELPRFHEFLRGLGIRPTYFTAYQVAHQPASAAVIKELAGDADAEVAAHLHAWNTPPQDEAPTSRNTMLCNLPHDLQRAKLEVLTEELAQLLGKRPTTFRAGRFGMSAALVRPLLDLGYRADSSVTPYWNWSSFDDGPDHRGAPGTPYLLSPEAVDVRVPHPDGVLLELPLSIGYTRRPFRLWSRIHDCIDARPIRPLRLAGVASRLGVVRKVVLTPEGERPHDLVAASRQLIREGGYLHMFMHSSSLIPGRTPFTPTEQSVAGLYACVASYVRELRQLTAVEFDTVAGFADRLLPAPHNGEGRVPVTRVAANAADELRELGNR